MKLPHSVCEVLRDHVVLESECIDRMYLNVYVPQLQRIGGVVWYLRGHLGQRFASTAGVAPKTEAFVADIERFVADNGVEMVSFSANTSARTRSPSSTCSGSTPLRARCTSGGRKRRPALCAPNAAAAPPPA